MKITIYELLGLIKDGKQPKKIKWGEQILLWDEKRKDYVFVETEGHYYLFLGFQTFYLNDEIEIIEESEDKEYEDIEELDILPDCESYSNKILYGKINALIRNQKKILERLDK